MAKKLNIELSLDTSALEIQVRINKIIKEYRVKISLEDNLITHAIESIREQRRKGLPADDYLNATADLAEVDGWRALAKWRTFNSLPI